jgi:hypothetical protein
LRKSSKDLISSWLKFSIFNGQPQRLGLFTLLDAFNFSGLNQYVLEILSIVEFLVQSSIIIAFIIYHAKSSDIFHSSQTFQSG